MLGEESTTERFFVPADGADDNALNAGFEWLRRFASEGGYGKAAVFVPGLREVEALGRAIGDSDARVLEKDRSLRAGGITIDLLIERRLPYAYKDGPVLAVWADDQQLDKLDGLRAPALCAIRWNQGHIDGWKLNWKPNRCSHWRTQRPRGHGPQPRGGCGAGVADRARERRRWSRAHFGQGRCDGAVQGAHKCW